MDDAHLQVLLGRCGSVISLMSFRPRQRSYRAPGSRSEAEPGTHLGRLTLDDLGPAEPGVKVIDPPLHLSIIQGNASKEECMTGIPPHLACHLLLFATL